MAENVEQVEAETITGEMRADKKTTLLAIIQANHEWRNIADWSINAETVDTDIKKKLVWMG